MSFFQRLFGQRKPQAPPAVTESTPPKPEPKQAPPAPAPVQPDPDTEPMPRQPAVTEPLSLGQTRPLNIVDDATSYSTLVFGQGSHKGRLREGNEDTFLTLVGMVESSELRLPFGIFVVADGMGGHEHGERASILAAKTITWNVMDRIFMPVFADQEPDEAIQSALEEAMHEANLVVKRDVPDGGTTSTVAVIRGNSIHIAHVGDSRAYLYHDKMLERLTRDHSLVGRLVEIGQMTEEEAKHRSDRNKLYQGIGLNDALDVHQVTRIIPPGSQLLLCSDGLWDVVEEDQMVSIITATPDANEACNKLIDMANENGGPDNITVLLIRFPL
ncbi:MAG: serine/threonine-protein phosphatase [Anaerolineae bacterium]|nr:serine/threonine-protein phosphatase [Anaerolineae bacterium]